MVGDEELCRVGAAAPSPETEGSAWAFDLSHSETSSLPDEGVGFAGDSASATSSGEGGDSDRLSAEVGTRVLSVLTPLFFITPINIPLGRYISIRLASSCGHPLTEASPTLRPSPPTHPDAPRFFVVTALEKHFTVEKGRSYRTTALSSCGPVWSFVRRLTAPLDVAKRGYEM